MADLVNMGAYDNTLAKSLNDILTPVEMMCSAAETTHGPTPQTQQLLH